MKSSITAKTYISFIVIGLAGQLAWSVENMYLNVFLYNTISQNTSYISLMVAASAVTATLATFIMGAISDRVGKRKLFIALGYILWALSITAFGFVDNTIFKTASAAALAIVILDCVMTFLGSTANDAAFNAYVTENTDEGNRGRVEGILAMLPLLSMLIIFGLFDPLTQSGKWKTFFNIFALINLIAGLVAFSLINDSKTKKNERNVFKDLVMLFSKQSLASHKRRSYILIAFGIFNTALQIFMPFIIIYIQHYLGYDNYALLFAVVLLGSSAISVASGRISDRIGKVKMSVIGTLIMIAGLVLMFFTRSYFPVMIVALIAFSGYMITIAALNALIRDETPRDVVGAFQGVRLIFQVALPMIIGPFIGNLIIKSNSNTYIELGEVKNVPTPGIFLASAICLLLTFFFLFKINDKEVDCASSLS